jgi:hypothetical protein
MFLSFPGTLERPNKLFHGDVVILVQMPEYTDEERMDCRFPIGDRRVK